jgi:hypothetical protein
MGDTCYVYRDGKIQEILKSQLDQRPITLKKYEGREKSLLHGAHELDDLRQQHQIDSDYNKREFQKKLREEGR